MNNEKIINDYYIILIIISVIGFALLILFAIYFLYIPFIRINSILDDIFDRGNEIIKLATGLESQAKITNKQLQSLYIGFCKLNDQTVFCDDEFKGFIYPDGCIPKSLIVGNTFNKFCENLKLKIK